MKLKPSIVKWILMGMLFMCTIMLTWALMPETPKETTLIKPTPLSSERKIEEKADKLLKEMSKNLQALDKFKFTAQGYYEVILDSLDQKIQITNAGNISVQRPDKLKAERTGEIADLEMYLNKGNFSLYGKKLNLYANTFTGNTLDKSIDYLQENLDITLPASDLLYSDVYSSLLEDVNSGFYVGQSIAGNEVCDHLAFSGKEVDWQIWIDSKKLPRRYVITSKKEEGSPEYAIEISDWNTNPKFNENTFVFNPPAKAEKIEFLQNKDIHTKNRTDK
jgi:hypothetical protein